MLCQMHFRYIRHFHTALKKVWSLSSRIFNIRWLKMLSAGGFIFCFTFVFSIVHSQDSQKMSFSRIESGLFNEWISSITQDSLGFIWVGTQDGLHRYDGYKFEVIRNSPEELQSPAANWIRDIAIDSNEDYWLSTYGGGLSKFSAKDMTFMNFEADSLRPSQGKQAYKVALVSENLVLSISDEGFHIYDIHTNNSTSLGMGGLFSCMTKTENELWLSDRHKLFEYSIENQNVEHLKSFDSDIHLLQNIPQIGTLVGLEDRLMLYNKENLICEIDLDEPIIYYTSNGAGEHYLASYTNLYKFNTSLFQLAIVPIDLGTQNQVVESIFLDRQSTLWIGTNKGLFKEKKYSSSFLPESIEFQARSILKHNESLYLGGFSGLFRINEGKITSVIKDKSIQSIRTVNDTILASTYGPEVIRIWKDQPLDTLFLPANSDTNEGVFGITTDRSGRLWMGTKEGLYVYSRKKQDFKIIPLDTAINASKIQIVNIHLDKKDRLWVFTAGEGIYMINNLSNSLVKNIPSQLVNYRNIEGDDNSLTSNIILTMEEDHQGQLWFGTDIGVVKYVDETDNFHRLQYQGKLFDKKIMMVVKDNDQNLWLSTINDGIYVFNEIEETIRHFTVDDGLISNAFLYGSGYFDKNNKTMFLGTDAGVQQIDLSKPFNKENNTFPIITNFQVNNITGNTPFKSLQIPYFKEITLEAAQNDFSVSFSGMDFIAPGKTGFSYTLDNDLWKVTDLQTAYFTNVPYGKHTLKVKLLYDGIPNDKNISSLDIYIAPPWYLSQIAKAFYILLFLTSLWGIYQYQKWQWEMRFNLKLKEDEAESLKKLNDFKSTLYTDIAHEFRTPLTLIAGPIEDKLRAGNVSEQDLSNFSLVQRNTNRLTSLVDQLLELAGLENGKVNLKVAKGDLGLFLNILAKSFDYQAQLKCIKYTVDIEPIGDVWYDEDVIEKIVSNLLSNAFKYTREEGKCSIVAKKEDDIIKISVKNTAENAASLQLEKLFTRFYQNDSYSEGMGVGLALVKELTSYYGGSINVSLEEEEIVHFSIRLPYHQSDFKSEDVLQESTSLNDKKILSPLEEKAFVKDCKENKDLPILLIVEDQPEIRAFVKHALQKQYNVLEAKNGKEGITLALERIPDIILSDIRMPFASGIDLCNTLKADERTSHIPVILLTGGAREANELKGLESGADDFITKPFKLRILEKRIANLITQRKLLRNKYSKEFILKPKEIAITPADETFLNKIQQILDENLFDSGFNATVFSAKANMSRMQLHRKLMVYTGLSTSAFIRSERLKQAIHLLETSDLTINELAYTTGFNTPSYFMTSFKEAFKKTPSEYLKFIQER